MYTEINKMSEDLIVIGKFKRSHGVRGHIRVQSYTDPASNLLLYPLFLNAKHGSPVQLEIEAKRQNHSDIILKIKGYDSPENAAKLTNQLIYTNKELMPDLEADETYWVDLIGCTAVFEGSEIGTVVDIMDTGSNENLVVKGTKKQYLVPYTNDAVGKVDIANKSIELLWHPEDML